MQIAPGVVGKCDALQQAFLRLERLARTDLPLLIVGETGTGKESAARHAHRASRRSGRRLLPINCAALSETLVLAELFGHARGAFTGAVGERMGVFEAARGGTVFLDEVGDLPASAQGLFLRVLQEGEVRRLGESRPRQVDVGVISATHRDLERQVRRGSFREDLYYRLRAGCVTLPPLRRRGRDILRLAEHFLGGVAAVGEAPARLSPEAATTLMTYPWPGNVRELEYAVKSAAALSDGGCIAAMDLDLPRGATGAVGSYHNQIESLRRRLVVDALDRSGGNRAQAGRDLGLSRQAVSYLVRSLQIRGSEAHG